MATNEISLWDGPAPGSEAWDHEELLTGNDGWVRNIVVPTLTAYVPDGGADRAVVVLPGGGFHFVSMLSEGRQVAELLQRESIAAFVLKYRVIPTPPGEEEFGLAFMEAIGSGLESFAADILPMATADAARAIDLVRDRGYGHLSVLGFSAGGRIAAELVLRQEGPHRPDAAAIVYLPTVSDAVAPEDAPPLFLLAAADDPLGIDGSLELHAAWRDGGYPVEIHLFEKGGHGFGMNRLGLPVDRWPDLFLDWYRALA